MSTGARNTQEDLDDDCSDDSAQPRPPTPSERVADNSGAHKLDNSSHLYLVEGSARSNDAQLLRTEQLLALAEKSGGLGTWEIEIPSRKLTPSDNLCKLLGYPPGTQFQDDEYWAMIHPVDREDAWQIATLALHACAPFEFAARIYTAERSVRWHIMSGLPLNGESGKLERVIGVFRDITDQARTEEEMHKLSQQLMRARDDERRHMARELHESAGQTLAALKMNLARLDEELPEDCDKGREVLRSTRELADAAVREVRTISYLMHPPMLDEAGLHSALRWLARGFSERSKIRVDLEITEDFGRQSQEIETTIFRVVQEALTNIHRYSGSRTASIRLARNPESVSVEIEDAGCGIVPLESPGQRQASPGVGIAGMRERITELEGTFQIESAPGRGTIIRIVLPLIAEHGATGMECRHGDAQNLA